MGLKLKLPASHTADVTAVKSFPAKRQKSSSSAGSVWCLSSGRVSRPVAGGDDRRVLLWHMEKAIHGRSKPVKLKGEHLSNIFCLAFDSTNKKVFSGGKSSV